MRRLPRFRNSLIDALSIWERGGFHAAFRNCGGPATGSRNRPHRWLSDPSSGGAFQKEWRVFDAKRWRVRAEQSRALADEASDPTARAILLEIARAYEHLAQGAETRDEKSAFAAPRAFFHIG